MSTPRKEIESVSHQAFDLEIADHIARLTLKGENKANAMGPAFWRECPEVFAALDQDERVRVVVISGKGENFSYGLDLLAMAGELGPLISGNPGAAQRAQLFEKITAMQGAISALAKCRKPVVAAVQGWCIGGALDLLAACDLRFCSADARFSLREVRVAMVADVGSLQRLPHIIGDAATRELALTGKDIDASRAAALGLVSEVLPDGDALFERAFEEARRIAKNPPLVVQGIKAVMNSRTDDEVSRGLNHVAAWNAGALPSDDLAEALAAFMEKREPVFKGG
jgi:enoyl-CoA hydratase